MHIIFVAFVCLVSSYVRASDPTVISNPYPWLSLPATPQLPLPRSGKYVTINGVSIWYTTYGPSKGTPVLFLHGGFGNSDYWGLQVQQLKSSYRCILMDSRGQGRSTLSSIGVSYDLMTSDVVSLLNYLNIPKVHVVGWSDGAIIGLNLAMKYPGRLSSLFAFAANYVPTGVKDISISPVFMAYLQRTEIEYNKLNPQKNYTNLYNAMIEMWSTTPNWSQQDFSQIPTTLPILIVDGDHEEAIYREQPDTMTSWIPQAGELITPRTSHFAFIQQSDAFTEYVTRFLCDAKSSNGKK